MEYKIMGTYDGKHNETQLIDKNGEKNNLKSKNNDENIYDGKIIAMMYTSKHIADKPGSCSAQRPAAPSQSPSDWWSACQWPPLSASPGRAAGQSESLPPNLWPLVRRAGQDS
jgi:hypothetical protein